VNLTSKQASPFSSQIHRTSWLSLPAKVVVAEQSTFDQDLSGQVERLTKEGAVRVFEDVISGKTFERPGLTALIDYARSGDTLAVIRLDRLGRSLKQLLETVDALKVQNIGLISLEERIDTTSAAGELVFHVFGAIAHFERRLISERTKDGLAAAKKHGRNPGRPSLQPETISALQKLVAAGTSVSQAAKHLGIGRSTAYKAVSNTKQK
jgi:DNA invertase Pin-like site-specific DNA recombinase